MTNFFYKQVDGYTHVEAPAKTRYKVIERTFPIPDTTNVQVLEKAIYAVLVGLIETDSHRERHNGPVIWVDDLGTFPSGTKIYAEVPYDGK